MKSINDLFNNVINEEGTLFKNPEVFTLEYLPEALRFRDKQLQAMVTYSKSLNSGYHPSNMEITGPYGTGKTTTVKKYFEIIKKQFDNVITVHLNCQFDVTENQMLTKIYNVIYNKKANSGVTNYLLKNKIISYLAETEKVLIVCLDDYGSNKISKEDIEHINRIMYTLLRAHETDPRVKISVITITNRRYINFVLSSSVETIFRPTNINFDAYSLSQMNSILTDRCNIGFAKGVINNEIITKIANHAYEEGDLRVGIRDLFNAGRNAELLNSSTIECEHLSF